MLFLHDVFALPQAQKQQSQLVVDWNPDLK
jgi:hypothetical protein